MKVKTFKTIDEQVEILRGKGLIIDDVDSTKEILLRENYFFLLGYRHVFLRDENSRDFIPGTNFRELYALFTFDRQIRNIIFHNSLPCGTFILLLFHINYTTCFINVELFLLLFHKI